MSCDICGRGACSVTFHSHDEQNRYEKVIELFDRAREERQKVRDSLRDDHNDGEGEG